MGKVDEALWEECLELTAQRPAELPWKLGEILDPPCRVWLVDGSFVKVTFDMDFVEGNNSEESAWVPKNSIWLDGTNAPGEWAFNLYHEAHEVRDMRGGMSYEAAHKRANAGEKELRKRALAKDGYG